MAETSGFFDAEELVNGTFDREYLADQFASYFKLFVGNGVFSSPTNQLKVVADSGMNIIVKAGWAFINGYWYHNDSDLSLTVPINSSAATIRDGIFIQFDNTDREIRAVVGEDRTTVNRTLPIYEIKIAEISIAPGTIAITDAMIADTRSVSSVCGFVTGIINVIDTEDLFEQYTAIFNDWYTEQTTMFVSWFNEIKGQLSDDAATDLQNQINEMKYMYVLNETLYLPNTAATYDPDTETLTIGFSSVE